MKIALVLLCCSIIIAAAATTTTTYENSELTLTQQRFREFYKKRFDYTPSRPRQQAIYNHYANQWTADFHSPPDSPRHYNPTRSKSTHHQVVGSSAFNMHNFNQKPHSGSGFTSRRSFNLPPPPPPSNTCGIIKPLIRNKVANGRDTEHVDWPWYVRVIVTTDSEAYCGGTLISNEYVLTAAHCYDDIPLNEQARSTAVLISGVKINGLEVEARALEVILHPGYVPAVISDSEMNRGIEPGPTHDIALIKLHITSREVIERLVPACLPEKFVSPLIGSRCKIMGHGFTNAHDERNFIMPRILQMADVYISENNVCKAEVDSDEIKSKITRDTLCIRGPIHPCVGDSGGPLVCKGQSPRNIRGEISTDYDYEIVDEEEEWYLVGVTSFAVSTDLNDKCGLFKSAVFGKVSNHRDWIRGVANV